MAANLAKKLARAALAVASPRPLGFRTSEEEAASLSRRDVQDLPALGRLLEEACEGKRPHQSCHSRPGSRVVISWSSHPLPSGSLNEA